MTQPKYAPILQQDEVRPSSHLAPPQPWQPHRPGDFVAGAHVQGRGMGAPGPDQGYALRLVERFMGELVLSEGEHPEDVVAGVVAIAMARAASFGRAPVTVDLEVAFALFGFLAPADPELVEQRRKYFAGADHDYWTRRMLASSVPDDLLRARLETVAGDTQAWRRVEMEGVDGVD